MTIFTLSRPCLRLGQFQGRIIRACSNPGDLMLDPFGGSDTTPVAARKLQRRFLGFELSPDYAAAIRRRLDAARPGQPLEGSPEPTAGGKGRRPRARSR
jgi:site-specific DNA-methyltransferase (adenine-specific)